jgi:glycosyltransferase involved in cell wall biosynthesis
MPFPLIGGDRIKPYNLLKHLSKGHNVTLVTFYQGKKDYKEFIKELEKLGVKVYVIPLNPIKAGLSCLTRIYQFRPLEIMYYHQKEFQQVVDDLMNETKFDVGFSFFMRTSEYLKNKNIKKILIAEDCRILYQHRSYNKSQNLMQKAIRLYEYKTLTHFEPKIMDYFDLDTFVTYEDINYLKSIKPLNKYRLLTNGADIEHFVPGKFEDRNLILFTGKLDLWANKLMMDRILERLMPEVNKVFPDIVPTFVGADVPKYIKDYERRGKIILHENVPDFLPYLQKARVYIHPHLGASGIQNKLLEAMSTGCPVVTTNSGNQGIYGEHGKHLFIGETDTEIAQLIIELLKNEKKAREISENARKLIIETHSWQRVFKDLDSIINELGNE